MKGITYALWDIVDRAFASWSWQSYKRAQEELGGYYNNHNLRILKVRDGVILHECNRFVNKPTRRLSVNLKRAQAKLY